MKMDRDYKRQQAIFRGYAKNFQQWRRAHQADVFDTAAEAGIETSLKVGDKVTFKNCSGVLFPGHRILGFCKTDERGGCVFLDVDCFWMPMQLKSLILEDSL